MGSAEPSRHLFPVNITIADIKSRTRGSLALAGSCEIAGWTFDGLLV